MTKKTTPNPRRLSMDEVAQVVGGTAGGGSNNDPLVGGTGVTTGPGYDSSHLDLSGVDIPGEDDQDSVNGGT
ncbi:hypothetical protein [Azospirillum sp.]|uniref:hypothetical protein n=1 Tax=Azospirillum sp. TaxID=34012 RepID=UPI002D293DFE|nr:hypothetical protein [Azospirillum sp.]HYD68483.1 hypothetical protein [Azospirillum sp.]